MVAKEPTPGTGPIVAPLGSSAAQASHPTQEFDDATYHTYEANPAPWWVGAVWLSFFIFGLVYLVLNLGQ